MLVLEHIVVEVVEVEWREVSLGGEDEDVGVLRPRRIE